MEAKKTNLNTSLRLAQRQNNLRIFFIANIVLNLTGWCITDFIK